MMKKRLLTYCILLVLCFVDVKILAFNETPDFNSLLTCLSTENSDLATDRMQLKGTDVKVNINGSIAKVTVRQKYKNNSNQILNGQYTFPAPARGFVHDMKMKTGDNIFKAQVKEQKSAQEDFTRFKEEGKNALLLKQENPNLFTMDLANIMPGETVDIELSYTELLIPDNMNYEFVYPAVSAPEHTDQSEAEFDIEVNLSAGIPIQELMCSTHETDIIVDTETSAKVILTDKEKKSNNRNYILNYRLAEQKMPTGLILSGGEDENFLLLNEYVGLPGLKDISVKFTDLKTYDLEPSNIPALSGRRPVTILGKWEGEADGFIKVEGRKNRRDYAMTYRLVKNNSRKTNGALKHLWAGKRIERLSGFEGAGMNTEITDLGLKYNVLTKNTSLLAYNDIVTKTVTPVEEVEESLTLPEKDAEPEPVRIAKVPEPGFYIILLIMTAVLFTGNIRRKAAKAFSRGHRG